MTIQIHTFTLGPLGNNTYLVADPHTRQAAVIDPTFNAKPVLEALDEQGWQLQAIWITHAHFDHIAGVGAICEQVTPAPSVALHALDLPLWRAGGGAQHFGFHLPPLPDPAVTLAHGATLTLGQNVFEVRHAPGHSPGHVIFYHSEQKAAFCGDVIFYRSIGRTDLYGGSSADLVASIRAQVYTLPPETRLLSGHGPETTVGDEIRENPFVGIA